MEYDPWGKVSREEGIGDSLRRFTGKMLDPESGLYYYGGRYYDPELGKFISPDPFVGQPGDPQNLNRYAYVLNNPVNYVDPSGYFFKKLFKKIKKVFTKYIFPVFRIIVGIGQLATGNPMGLFNIASGASSFARGRDAQLFSRISGFIADAASTFPTGDTGPPSGGGSSRLGYFEGEEGRGPTGGGGSSRLVGWLFDTLGNLAATVAEASDHDTGRGPVVRPRGPTPALRGGVGIPQRHHAISKTVHDALQDHRNLKGHYQYKDPRFTAQASSYEAHYGRSEWHRRLDANIAEEITRRPHWTPRDFERYLHNVYNRPEQRWRFPGGLEPDLRIR